VARTPLPIDAHLDAIRRQLKQAGALVLSAEPGAGKTTRVPEALLADYPGQIWVSEPRRLAARLAARRVAEERGERLGGVVGYSVRFEDVTSAETRLRYVTEGVLVRKLLTAPSLPEVSVIVLDELHERSLNTDLALALVEHLRRGPRRDLALVVMSATLDAAHVGEFLGCPHIGATGRAFPLSIDHLDDIDDRPLDKQVASAVRRLVLEERSGDILAFVPGAREIRAATDTLGNLAREAQLSIHALHGDLPLDEQVRALAPAAKRKVVLATNVAESSVTVPGVTAVIDSGQARVARVSPWSGLPKLQTVDISRASADQRAGRAGRTAPGRVLRLFTRGSLERRPAFDAPEIERADLAELLLTLLGSGIQAASELRWLSEPPAAALAAAGQLLRVLLATDEAGQLTAIGRRMLRLPMHPRLARLMLEGERRGVAKQAALAAALLSERDIVRSARTRFDQRGGADVVRGPSDVLERIDRFEEARNAGFARHTLAALDLDPTAVRAVERTLKRLERSSHNADDAEYETADAAIQRAVLAGFADRLARRKRPGGAELILASGKAATLSETSVVKDAILMCAVEADESSRGGGNVRIASAVEPEWLLEGYDALLTEHDALDWSPSAKRVVRVTRMNVGSVVLDENISPAPPSAEASALLAAALGARLASRPEAEAAFQRLTARLSLLAQARPELGELGLVADVREKILQAACDGAVSLAEVGELDIASLALSHLPPHTVELLARFAPERATLAGGRSLEVQYVLGQPPFIASRLQDFFGMTAGPRVADGRVPLTLHLLAPNKRAVQVTSDLAGFWQRHYPGLRKTLMRRYPKHLWPEDGATARPPTPGKIR
jgi:ATP-dependent helicase HrpB